MNSPPSRPRGRMEDPGPAVAPVAPLGLPQDAVLDRLRAMMVQEVACYHYESYFPALWTANQIQDSHRANMAWREKICQWSYNVVDHFDLPREVVAISLNYFDRYLATRADQTHPSTGNLALLASLTTLHIAIKVHAPVDIRLSTLASLSRGQFGPTHIEQMEWQIMGALGWRLHPPTLFAFVSYYLMLFQDLPSNGNMVVPPVHHSVRKELFEVAIYMAELSVCDSYFVPLPASVVAMAALANVMDNSQIMPETKLSMAQRRSFWGLAGRYLGFFDTDDVVPPATSPDDAPIAAASVMRQYQLRAAKDRLRVMYDAAVAPPPPPAAAAGGDASMNDGAAAAAHRQQLQQPQAPPPPNQGTVISSPTSTIEMAEDNNTLASSSMDGSCGGGPHRHRMQETTQHEQYYYHNQGNKIAANHSTAAAAAAAAAEADAEAVDANAFRYSPSPPQHQYHDQNHGNNNYSNINNSNNNSLSNASTSSSSHSRRSYRYLSSSSNASLGRMACSPIVAGIR